MIFVLHYQVNANMIANDSTDDIINIGMTVSDLTLAG